MMNELRYGQKFCRGCRTLKPLSEFYPDKNYRFGVSNRCKDCVRTRAQVNESNWKWRKANPFKNAVHKVKMRSRKKKIPFDLDIEHLEQLWEICGGICPMTGVPMLKISRGGSDPFVMSVDRIIPEKGYIKGNVRLVSLWYNAARSNNDDEFTLEMFQRTIDHTRARASYPPRRD